MAKCTMPLLEIRSLGRVRRRQIWPPGLTEKGWIQCYTECWTGLRSKRRNMHRLVRRMKWLLVIVVALHL
jgi:hypothetical protein